MAEAADLEPQLKLINAGKEGLDDTHRDETFGKFKRQRTQEGSTVNVPTTHQLEAAGTAFHKFLQDGTNSPLRSFVTLLSTGGIFYATQAADKTARAWLENTAADENTVKEAVKVRIGISLKAG